MFDDIVTFIRSLYGSEGFVPLHEPCFRGNEKKYLLDCVDSTFVSSVGEYVTRFEDIVAGYTGSKYAVATVNGTSALHVALLLAGVERGDEVITQALSFVATSNAISYCGASPVFVDVDVDTLGMSPGAVKEFLDANVERKDGRCYNRRTGRRIAACVPVHVLGHPCRIDEIVNFCEDYGIPVVEDAAESLGSRHKGKHTGTFGMLGVLSFNGNKTVTCGGGGAIITDDEACATKGKHLTTTAKKAHKWEYVHDSIGFNYRMPNINAALACAQMEELDGFIENKRETASKYKSFFEKIDVQFVTEPLNTHSNFWLNAVLMADLEERDEFLEYAASQDVMCRPVWTLMSDLAMFQDCQSDTLSNSKTIAARLVNIPSGVRV